MILAAGIGNPFVTTDTAAAQRAFELEADVVLKATRVDGVYSDDPEKNPHAVLYESLSYADVIGKNLRVMDATAIALCQEHEKPILVFNFKKEGNIIKAISGDTAGTWIGPREIVERASRSVSAASLPCHRSALSGQVPFPVETRSLGRPSVAA